MSHCAVTDNLVEEIATVKVASQSETIMKKSSNSKKKEMLSSCVYIGRRRVKVDNGKWMQWSWFLLLNFRSVGVIEKLHPRRIPRHWNQWNLIGTSSPIHFPRLVFALNANYSRFNDIDLQFLCSQMAIEENIFKGGFTDFLFKFIPLLAEFFRICTNVIFFTRGTDLKKIWMTKLNY